MTGSADTAAYTWLIDPQPSNQAIEVLRKYKSSGKGDSCRMMASICQDISQSGKLLYLKKISKREEV